MKWSIKQYDVTEVKNKDQLYSKLNEYGKEGKIIKEFSSKDEAIEYFEKNYEGSSVAEENKAQIKRMDIIGKPYEVTFFAVVLTTETEEETEEEYGIGSSWLYEHCNGVNDFLYCDNIIDF